MAVEYIFEMTMITSKKPLCIHKCDTNTPLNVGLLYVVSRLKRPIKVTCPTFILFEYHVSMISWDDWHLFISTKINE